MTITIVIINPRQECGWRHTQERWAKNLQDFEKRFSWIPTMVLRSWSLTMQLRIWDWTMQADNWVSAIRAENWVLCYWVEFSAVAEVVNFFEDELRYKTPREMPNVGGVVSIVWFWKTSKNCVSLLVSKNRRQKLIKPFVPEQRSPPVCICVCICLNLQLYMYCLIDIIMIMATCCI